MGPSIAGHISASLSAPGTTWATLKLQAHRGAACHVGGPCHRLHVMTCHWADVSSLMSYGTLGVNELLRNGTACKEPHVNPA